MATPQHSPQMLTPIEVSELLRLHIETVREMLRTGELPGVKIGRVWRIPSDALNEWASKRGAK